jgi:outer membrane biogenesis lipoprotein LolB
MLIVKFLLISFCMLLISCAPFTSKKPEIISYQEYIKSVEQTKIFKFEMSGKISVFIEKKGFSGRISWYHNKNKSNIRIYNPFNAIISEITIDSLNESIVIVPIPDDKNKTDILISKLFSKKSHILILKDILTKLPNYPLTGDKLYVRYKDWIVYFENIKEVNGAHMPHIIKFEKDPITLKIFINNWVI